ncbi:hypothetical protein VOLCADRAFT_94686 [Volvox carteri f. nagariensis]|uniref:Uncharacterized protein n=1 Tax=Volvox carteri f. nagariensis TaxID=3068 RepID=D8U5G7_VOLCA|nr:uncharacterized protein VOLCADRAFT_94686 [Volvox carteri f. nagariensis]EFJ44998.1 hypothetical protein VOLCADRAFT_94686 [Volvox carteri f. nagariensis]|eukprot:XP_002953969.1 hypothetical protein VOLCADRAFT_94686 [Volvox carteri f. nagariensis]
MASSSGTSRPPRPPLYQPLNIDGWTVLITGASSGFGEAMAWRFAEAGCRLVLLARRQDRLESLRDQLHFTYHVPVHTVQLDVRNIAEVDLLPQQLPEEFATVDILVNNAGLALGTAAVQDNCMDDAVTMIETNVTAVIAMTKAFVQGMIERNRGHIVNISSIAGLEAYGGGSVYCATKHALAAFTTASRHDLVGTNIRVTSISPGAAQTEFSLVRFKGDQDKADAVYQGFDPLTAEDIADNVLYACTRPEHVQIADILVLATNQASAKGIARVHLAQER